MMRIKPKTSVRGVLTVLTMAALLTPNFAMPSSAAPAAPVPAPAAAAKGALVDLQSAFTSVADQVEPAVVYIETEKKVETSSSDPFFDFFRNWPFGGIPSPRQQPRTDVTKARGSGVIVRSDGYILTNDHVVGGADKVTVILSDKKEYKGTVLRDPVSDLALVKIDAKNLPAAILGDSDKVRPGQWAIAIGNPGGQFTNTLTVGVVSAKTREFRVPDEDSPNGYKLYPDAIQTDAAINPGNSGGPLLNIDGEIIGINAAIWSPTGSSVGIGFAIPSNAAKWTMEQLISKGKVIRGKLGVQINDLTADQSTYYGVTSGALVQSVEENSPAKKAGVEVEDVIIQVGGQKVDSSANLVRTVERMTPGSKTTLIVLRDKKRVTLNVTIGEMTGENASAPDKDSADIGITATELTPEIARQLGLGPSVKGVAVESVDDGSPADRAGIAAGDVIIRINRILVTSMADYKRITSTLKSGDAAMFVLYRVVQGRGQTRIAGVRLD